VLRSVKAKEEEVQRLAVKLDEHQKALPEAQRKVGTQRDHLAVAQHELGEKRSKLDDVERRHKFAEEELVKVKVRGRCRPTLP
jgi:chromosome segregation ATPase